MNNKATTLTEHQQLWLDRIKACEASGLPVTQYAPANGLSVRGMYDAKRALVSKGVLPRKSGARFQRVKIAQAPVAVTSWTVTLPNGATVSFAGKVDPGSLGQVLSAVSRLP